MKPEYLGARASNTGDDFHEWWALRLALQLLAPDTSLTAVTVEGVNLDNKNAQNLTEWDSVDCGLFYGGHSVEKAKKIVFEQLKYSPSTPEKNWTVSELTNSNSKSSNNSIIKGLADSFSAILKTRPDLIDADALTIRLVSNRAVGMDLQKSLSDASNNKHETLRVASALNKTNFKKFIKLFDFSDCGAGSRFAQEENAINEILALTHSADRGFVLDLKDRVHKLMLPEATGSYITRETVLTWMNVSDPLALFPCPPRLKAVDSPVNRNAAVAIQAAMVSGDQFICLHGEGGSGKTTVLKQVESLLPEGSVMITYDCYGAGTYLDSEAYRHRPKDAYLQIINEISVRLRLPLLISQDNAVDFIKAFSLRIESASKILEAQEDNALLVVVIDAADNSVAGANQCKPEEISFVHELIKIGNLPTNVRLIISARTGRLDSLSIPAKYNSIEFSNFSFEETTLNVLNRFPSATEAWIEDFHDLSNRNPRVQSYVVVPDIDMNTVLTLAKGAFKQWPSVFSSGQRKVIANLIKISELRPLVVKDIYDRSVVVKDLKTAANEKISILLDLSRILLFVDKDEAREVFKIAVDIANDVDVDAMHNVAFFPALSKNAKNHFLLTDSQQIASQMASIITEYGTLLYGYDHFPWHDAISAVAILDMPKAISLIGYWEDCDLVQASETLPALISTGITEGTISSAQTASLLNFCDELDEKLVAKLASVTSVQDASQLVEEIAKAELLRFNRSGSPKICQELNELVPYSDSSEYWHSALNQLVEFRSHTKKSTKSKTSSDKPDSTTRRLKESEFLEGIKLAEISFESPSDFINSIHAKLKEARSEDFYITSDDILRSLIGRLESKDRITFLGFLTDENVIDDLGYTWAKTLIDSIELWIGSSFAISSWKKEHLPVLIANHLGEFSHGETYGYDKLMLKDVIDGLELNKEEAISLLLEGLEQSSEYLPLPELYSVVRLLTDYCSEEQIADVTTRYVQRLTSRLKLPPNIIKPECSAEIAFACQLYSFLGDVDTRVRWRAAHSIRASARMGDFNTIVALTALYERKSMPGYREGNAPFYWLSARLWLIVTFDRIASEVPEAIAPVARWLLSIATDQDFPHVLIRHFSKSCLMKLLSNDFIDFDEQERTALHALNTSELTTEKSKRRVSRGGFHEGGKERRFNFDSLDTLRYVYPSAIECFADIDEETFLDEAEAWIVDRWKSGSDLSTWENEPRKHKFERANYTLYSHSHGSMPTIERHRYYLEWHAMWCSLGSLMTVNALAKPEYEDSDYGTLNGFLRREGLTQPPHWSSDLRSPKPLEAGFHYPTTVEVGDWLATITPADFELELGLNSEDDNLVVDSGHDIRTTNHRSSVRISSSLVNPDTGLSLIRALQTSDDTYDYCLPSAGHESEIDDDPFVLRGWLSDHSGDARLDEKDVFNHGVRLIESTPSENVIEMLGLCRSESYPVSWVDSSTGDIVFHYEAWGDVRDDSQQREYIYGEDVISNGHRLKISLNHLKQYLDKVGFDLILEVEITRRANKDGITEYNEESEKTARYARLYLLRRTGEIFTTEGCVGTWTPPSD